MKINMFSVLSLLVLHSVSLFAQPEYQNPRYFPEIWRDDTNHYYSVDIPPDNGFFAYCESGGNEPAHGYPFHSGIVSSVSDTFDIAVKFKNRDQTAYNISSYSPDNWFTPVIFDAQADVRTAKPLVPPPDFGWEFKYWQTWNWEIVSQPTEIPSNHKPYTQYSIVYYLWGLPPGRYRVMMQTTPNAPLDFRLLINDIRPIWVTESKELKDELNAYAACFNRALWLRDFTGAEVWINRIFMKNQYSISGYFLLSRLRSAQLDGTGYVAALDSTIAIIKREGDPVLPPGTEMSKWMRYWYHDHLSMAEIRRYNFINGELENDYE